jgi:hypothetical protein
VAVVRNRNIPTERPPLVGEVSANLLRVEGVAWSAQRIPTADNLGFLDRSRYFFIQVAPKLSSWGWVDPVLSKFGRAGNRTQDFWICSEKFWPLDYRGGLWRQHMPSKIWFPLQRIRRVATRRTQPEDAQYFIQYDSIKRQLSKVKLKSTFWLGHAQNPKDMWLYRFTLTYY